MKGEEFPPKVELVNPLRWSEMDPNVRIRFHELGNHISRLEGIITGLSLKVPNDPAVVPVLQEKVTNLESSHRAIEAKVDKVADKLNSLTIKVVGASTLATALGSALAQYLIK